MCVYTYIYVYSDLKYGKQIMLYNRVLFPAHKECFKRILKEIGESSWYKIDWKEGKANNTGYPISVLSFFYTNGTQFLTRYLAALNKDCIFQLPLLQLGVTCD